MLNYQKVGWVDNEKTKNAAPKRLSTGKWFLIRIRNARGLVSHPLGGGLRAHHRTIARKNQP
jgi:hypothetical protein